VNINPKKTILGHFKHKLPTSSPANSTRTISKQLPFIKESNIKKKKTTTVKTHHAGGILASSRLSIRTIDDDAIVTKMIWHSDPEKPNKMRIEGQLEQTTIDE